MKYDPVKHHRRSIRLRSYDYAQAGCYFVTVCTQNRACLLGRVQDRHMILNDAGAMVERYWRKIPEKFPSLETEAWVVMPNHCHGIIAITSPPVGADPRVCPNSMPPADLSQSEHTGSPLSPISLGRVVQWFKTMTTNEYIRGVKQSTWPPFQKRLWQRNYYEHIVRDEHGCDRIRNYILQNPALWDKDQLHPENPSKW